MHEDGKDRGPRIQPQMNDGRLHRGWSARPE
jgi:hypothetical protein